MRILSCQFWLLLVFTDTREFPTITATMSPMLWSVMAYLHPLTTNRIHSNRPSQAIQSRIPLFAAKKKRRRRQDTPGGSNKDDLPEFDLEEGEIPTTRRPKSNELSNKNDMMMSSGPAAFSSSSSNPVSRNPLPPPLSARSVQDLIRDRSLESKLQFDEPPTDDSLPDLAVIATQSPPSLGKKRARQEAQRSMAQSQNRGSASAGTSDDDDTFWSKLPGIRDEKGEISPLKMLETGTWFCIGILVVWEVYLNSPFFERAAPMAPIVYQWFNSDTRTQLKLKK